VCLMVSLTLARYGTVSLTFLMEVAAAFHTRRLKEKYGIINVSYHKVSWRTSEKSA